MERKKLPQLNSKVLYNMGKAERVQENQIFELQDETKDISNNLDLLEKKNAELYEMGKELTGDLESFLDFFNNTQRKEIAAVTVEQAFLEYEKTKTDKSNVTKYDILRTQEIITHDNWDTYYENLSEYGKVVGIDDEEDPFLTGLSVEEYKKLDDEINGEFERITNIKNKTDIKFLGIAIALEVAKGLLFPIVAEKDSYGQAFNKEERMPHDDKSIKGAQKKANDKYRDKYRNKYGEGKWIEFLYQTVPFDITSGTGNMEDINLSGGAHRLYTLGHDPILGWIFGTANILTDIITISPGAVVSKSANSKVSNVLKFAGIRSYRIVRQPKMKVTPERVSMVQMFKESYKITCEDRMNLPAAIFAEGQHLKSDINTKMGLPVPVLEVLSPNFASKLYANNYDALCFARDSKIVGLSATISIFIDIVIGLAHGLYYDPKKDGSRDLYEVRTRKILLIANTIGTSSNLIFTFFSRKLKNMDIGGLLITLSHLFSDSKFLFNVKREFIEKKLYEKIDEEIKRLDDIETDLINYGFEHRTLYR